MRVRFCRNPPQSYDDAVANGPNKFRIERKGQLYELNVEQMRRVLGVFTKYDPDKKGVMTQENFIMAMRLLRIALPSKEDETRLFRKTDLDKNGTIAYEEFLVMACSKIGARIVPGIKVRLHRVDKLKIGKSNAKTEPIVQFKMGEYATQKLRAKKKTLNPKFDEDLFLPCPEDCQEPISIMLLGSSKIFRLDGRLEQEFLGCCAVEPDKVAALTADPTEFELKVIRESDEAPADPLRAAAASRRAESLGNRRGPTAAAGSAVSPGQKRASRAARAEKGNGGGDSAASPRSLPRHTKPAAAAPKTTPRGSKKPANSRAKLSAPHAPGRASDRAPTSGASTPRVSSSRHPNARQGSGEDTEVDYGTMYFSMARGMEHTRRETEDGEDVSLSGDEDELLADISEYEAIDLALKEMNLPEGQKVVIAHWDGIDPDGLGLASLHRISHLIKHTFPLIHDEVAIQEAYSRVLAAASDRPPPAVTRRSWVEPPDFLRLLCVTFHYKWLLDIWNSRSKAKGVPTEPDRYTEFKEFDIMIKRMKMADEEDSKTNARAWFVGCPRNERNHVKLIDLAYSVTIHRFFPGEATGLKVETADPTLDKIFGKRKKQKHRITLPEVGGTGKRTSGPGRMDGRKPSDRRSQPRPR